MALERRSFFENIYMSRNIFLFLEYFMFLKYFLTLKYFLETGAPWSLRGAGGSQAAAGRRTSAPVWPSFRPCRSAQGTSWSTAGFWHTRPVDMVSLVLGVDTARHCALIGWDHGVATPALLYHKDTAQGTLECSTLMVSQVCEVVYSLLSQDWKGKFHWVSIE